MLFGFGYSNVCYVLLIFIQKAEKNRLKKSRWPKFCNIIFLFLLKVGSIGSDQQITLFCLKYFHQNLFAMTFISPSFTRVFF